MAAPRPSVLSPMEPHRGRFQAQAHGFEASERWAQGTPLQALMGHHLLSYLEDKIPRKQADLRRDGFLKAHDLIDRLASQGGGGPEIKKTFLVRGGGSRRVDVEVWAGWAFV